jgi:hypothetical protein
MRLPKVFLPKLAGASAPRVAPEVKPMPRRERSRESLAPFGVYCGVWTATDTGYRKGDAVTFAGNVYLALRDTSASPGQSGDYRLICRRGKDGKDGLDLSMVDAEAVFEKDPVSHLTTKVKLLEQDTRVLIASIVPKRDAEGFMVAASIKVA